jgi:SAM-dependent methyltransferase
VSRGPRSIPRQLSSDDFTARQWAYFREADEAKFRWQTANPVLAASERYLVSVAAGEGRLLEVGCGEGGNLFHLGPRAGLTVGLDYSCTKLTFASRAIPWGRFVGSDALSLPFLGATFDRVFCRDVLHHLSADRQREAVAELFRVCRPGGEVVMIEPNGRNPLIAALALVTPAERGLFRSTPERLAVLIRVAAPALSLEMAQPLPVARAVLHYRYGVPALGRRPWAARALCRLDAMLARLIPRTLWAYTIVRVRRTG